MWNKRRNKPSIITAYTKLDLLLQMDNIWIPASIHCGPTSTNCSNSNITHIISNLGLCPAQHSYESLLRTFYLACSYKSRFWVGSEVYIDIRHKTQYFRMALKCTSKHQMLTENFINFVHNVFQYCLTEGRRPTSLFTLTQEFKIWVNSDLEKGFLVQE